MCLQNIHGHAYYILNVYTLPLSCKPIKFSTLSSVHWEKKKVHKENLLCLLKKYNKEPSKYKVHIQPKNVKPDFSDDVDDWLCPCWKEMVDKKGGRDIHRKKKVSMPGVQWKKFGDGNTFFHKEVVVIMVRWNSGLKWKTCTLYTLYV